MKYWLYLSIIHLTIPVVNAAELVFSNPDNKEQSFPFTISLYAHNGATGRMYVGANTQIEGNQFALSAANRQDLQWRPFAPAKLSINGVADQSNPLNGASFAAMAIMDSRLIAVTQQQPTKGWIVDDSLTPNIVQLFESPDFTDATGAPAAVTLLTTTSSNLQDEIPLAPQKIIAVTQNSAGAFGLNLLNVSTQRNSETGMMGYVFGTINAQDGSQGNQALAVTTDTQALFIGDPLSLLTTSNDIYFDATLQRFYLACTVTGGAATTDGVRSIAVGSFESVTQGEGDTETTTTKLVLSPIAPDSVFAGSDQIVGGIGSDSSFVAQRVQMMITSTYLHYLIVAGGNAASFNQEQIFALPIVSATGTLANVNAPVADQFVNGNPPSFRQRDFYVPAAAPDDVYTTSSIQAQVGGGAQLPGAITQMVVSGDTVFVSVAQTGNNEAPGIFYSQALFAVNGIIKSWTKWQRAVFSTPALFGMAFDNRIGFFWYLPTSAGIGAQDIFKTLWSRGTSPLEETVSEFFTKRSGGVQNSITFGSTYPGLSTTIGSRTSILALAGYRQLALVQTASDVNDVLTPQLPGTFDFTSTNGSLESFTSSNAMLISGGVLNQLNALTSCDILTDGVNGWLAVGGSNGVAILATSTGAGWDAATGLGAQFAGLTPDMSFQQIGTYTNVRRVMADGSNLFILTTTQLDRIAITPQAIATKNFSVTTVALATTGAFEETQYFSDFLVSGPLILLAATTGLYRSENLTDSTTASSITWDLIPLPELAGSLSGVGPITRLVPITTSGLSQDIVSGNVYVLNGAVSARQAQIYRLTLSQNAQQPTNITIQLLNDFFVKNLPTFFFVAGEYRSFIATDGAVFYLTRPANRTNVESTPGLEIAPPLKSNMRYALRGSLFLDIGQQGFRTIGQPIRDNGSGSWLVPGDFGIRLHM